MCARISVVASELYVLSNRYLPELFVPLHSFYLLSKSFAASFFFFLREESIPVISMTNIHCPYDPYHLNLLASIVSFIVVHINVVHIVVHSFPYFFVQEVQNINNS